MTDQELKDLVASLAVSQAKTDEQMKKTDEEMRKVFSEIRKSQAKTDEQIKELGVKFAETDRILSEKFTETKEQIKELGRRFGDFGNTRGEEVENFFYRYLYNKKRLGNIRFDNVERNMYSLKDQEHDIIMINGKASALISVKYKLNKEDVDDFINREMEKIKYFFGKLGSHHKLYGGVASYIIDKETENYAKEQGLFVITRSGDNTVILNEEGFLGKEF